MIKNIIFDLGGVIIKHKATLVEDMLSEVFPNTKDVVLEIWNKYQSLLKKGDKTFDEFVLELKRNINTELTPSQLKQKWIELYKKEASDLDLELLDYVDQLKGRYNVFLFTDTIDIHDEYNKTRNIYERFNKVYRSCREGVAKIEGKKAFLYLLDKIQAQPSECIFIDDKPSFIKFAQELGIKGIVYKDLGQLQDELKLQGIEV